MIVLDASAAVDLLLERPDGPWVRSRLDGYVHVPEVFDVEVVSAARRLLAARRIDRGRAEMLVAVLDEPLFVRHPHTPLLPRVWALRHAIAVADACYVALAEGLEAPLVTTDRRLARAHGHGARILAPD